MGTNPPHPQFCALKGGELNPKGIKNRVKIMLVRGVGIGDIGIILGISIAPVLKVLTSTTYTIKPKQTRYDCLEPDEFWRYGGGKEEQSRAYVRIAPGKRGDRGIYAVLQCQSAEMVMVNGMRMGNGHP
jgi:hypothetical protein